jgi:hypothetical protein
MCCETCFGGDKGMRFYKKNSLAVLMGCKRVLLSLIPTIGGYVSIRFVSRMGYRPNGLI